jgi:methionine--tRNA ligase beta chain
MKKDTISYSDFQKLDLRVGLVKTAERVENSEKLIRLIVDLGSDYGEVQILAGIAQWHKPKDLKNKKFIFLANLESKKMMGEDSNGMILCADTGVNAIILPVKKSVEHGLVIR